MPADVNFTKMVMAMVLTRWTKEPEKLARATWDDFVGAVKIAAGPANGGKLDFNVMRQQFQEMKGVKVPDARIPGALEKNPAPSPGPPPKNFSQMTAAEKTEALSGKAPMKGADEDLAKAMEEDLGLKKKTPQVEEAAKKAPVVEKAVEGASGGRKAVLAKILEEWKGRTVTAKQLQAELKKRGVTATQTEIRTAMNAMVAKAGSGVSAAKGTGTSGWTLGAATKEAAPKAAVSGRKVSMGPSKAERTAAAAAPKAKAAKAAGGVKGAVSKGKEVAQETLKKAEEVVAEGAETAAKGAGGKVKLWERMRGMLKGKGLLKGVGGLGLGWLALEFGPEWLQAWRETGGGAPRGWMGKFEATEAIRRAELQQMRRDRELQQLIRQNTAMLAQHDPHFFNQIMAGRRLPMDGVVLGGRPRTDLMEEIATQMSMGGFGQPSGQEEMAGAGYPMGPAGGGPLPGM